MPNSVFKSAIDLEKSFGLTKLYIVWICRSGWITSIVSYFREFDTAVTASDFSIANLITSVKEESCPRIVMSVPCSVVTTFNRL